MPDLTGHLDNRFRHSPGGFAATLLLAGALPFMAPGALGATPPSATAPPAPATSAATTKRTAASPAKADATAKAAEEATLPQSHVPPFAQVDTNHDGKIEWKEAAAVKVPKKVFDQFDFNHDGALSETEWLFVRLHMTDFTPPKGTVSAPAAATQPKMSGTLGSE